VVQAATIKFQISLRILSVEWPLQPVPHPDVILQYCPHFTKPEDNTYYDPEWPSIHQLSTSVPFTMEATTAELEFAKQHDVLSRMSLDGA